MMGEIVDVPMILFFEVDENVLIQRVTERSKASGRNDDNISVL